MLTAHERLRLRRGLADISPSVGPYAIEYDTPELGRGRDRQDRPLFLFTIDQPGWPRLERARKRILAAVC